MTGDISTNEVANFLGEPGAREAAAPVPLGPALHQYGRLTIFDAPVIEEPAILDARRRAAAPPPDMSLTEQLGSAALAQRASSRFMRAKAERPHAGRSWGAPSRGADEPQPIHLPDAGEDSEIAGAPMPGEAPAPSLTQRMTGKIALGLVIVSGTKPQLKFSQADKTLVVAEVQNGLSWLAAQSPAHDVTFFHDIRSETVTVPEVTSGTTYEAFEAPWRDAALAQMGFGAGISGVRAYANSLKASLRTDWAYVAFFTKYRLRHFAYAQIGGPKLIMHFANDGWGTSNIDRVFAHETGHIFRAPDEYAASGCSCDGSWGHFRRPNSNCENCAPGGSVSCIMLANDWTMCRETPYHLGYNGLPALAPGPVV